MSDGVVEEDLHLDQIGQIPRFHLLHDLGAMDLHGPLADLDRPLAFLPLGGLQTIAGGRCLSAGPRSPKGASPE